MRANEKHKSKKTKRYRKPNDEQLAKFNEEIKNQSHEFEDLTENSHEYAKALANTIMEAAHTTLTLIDPAQKRPYITDDTWNLIKERQE